MKKLFPIAIVALMGVAAFSSCTKKSTTPSSYTCTCTLKMPGTSADTTIAFPYGTSLTNDQATSTCSQQQTAYQQFDPAAKCSL